MSLDTPEFRQKHFDDIVLEIAKRKEVSPAQIKARLLKEFGPKLAFLFESHPYKIAHSGRYSKKSWSYSAALLQQGMERPLRIVCLRETMNSLKDSVHALMQDQIKRLRIGSSYECYKTEIRGSNGTYIFYAGLRGARAEVIKSMEGCDRFWVEEGQSVSKNSWLILDPTIRKPGAELWVSMNPRFFLDDSYQRWIVNPPPGAVVARMNYLDNEFLTAEMQAKIDFLSESDPDEYEHVYGGACKSTVQDAVYKAQIQNAQKEGRFRKVPYDPRKPVDVSFDLGWGDLVSMWFYQTFPTETRFIDYYENSHQPMDHYLHHMQTRGYIYGELVFPWDGGVPALSSGKSSEAIAKSKGFKTRLLRQGKVHDRIETVRTLFPMFWFDAANCEKGLEHLGQYQWGPPSATTGTIRRDPLHDIHSHAGDSLGHAAIAIKSPPLGRPGAGQTPPPRRPTGGALSGFR